MKLAEAPGRMSLHAPGAHGSAANSTASFGNGNLHSLAATELVVSFQPQRVGRGVWRTARSAACDAGRKRRQHERAG